MSASSEVSALPPAALDKWALKLVGAYVDEAITSAPQYDDNLDEVSESDLDSDDDVDRELGVGGIAASGKDTNDPHVRKYLMEEASKLKEWGEMEEEEPLAPNYLLSLIKVDENLGNSIKKALKEAVGDFDDLDKVWSILKAIRREYRRTRHPTLAALELKFPFDESNEMADLLKAYYWICQAQIFMKDAKMMVMVPNQFKAEGVAQFNEDMKLNVPLIIEQHEFRERIRKRSLRMKLRVRRFRQLVTFVGKLNFAFCILLHASDDSKPDRDPEIYNTQKGVETLNKTLDELAEFEKTCNDLPADSLDKYGRNFVPLPGFAVKMSGIQNMLGDYVADMLQEKSKEASVDIVLHSELSQIVQKARDVLNYWDYRSVVPDDDELD